MAESEGSVSPIGDEELELLRSAEANLTPGPWIVWDDGDIGTGYPVSRQRRNRNTGETEELRLDSDWLLGSNGRDSAQIVAIRNGLPGLLQRLSEAEDQIEELRGGSSDQSSTRTR